MIKGGATTEVADPGLHGYAALHHIRRYAVNHSYLPVHLVLLGVEGRFIFLILSPFPGPRKGLDRRTSPIEGCPGLSARSFVAQVLTHLTGPVHEIKPLHLFDRRHGGRQGNRMRLIRMPVGKEVVLEVFGNLPVVAQSPSGT